ncbi:hypothetical protein CFC21_003705, partial [Triticum aestivum]
ETAEKPASAAASKKTKSTRGRKK